jgi:hypothetical protein
MIPQQFTVSDPYITSLEAASEREEKHLRMEICNRAIIHRSATIRTSGHNGLFLNGTATTTIMMRTTGRNGFPLSGFLLDDGLLLRVMATTPANRMSPSDRVRQYLSVTIKCLADDVFDLPDNPMLLLVPGECLNRILIRAKLSATELF